MKYFALLGVLLFAIACGSKSDHGAFIDTSPTAGTGNTAGKSGHAGATGVSGSSGEASGGSGGDTTSELDPVVEITAPVAASDPNVDSVLIDQQVTVLCTAKPSSASGAKPVDASSIKISMLDASGKSLNSSAGAPTANKNEFSAAFVLTDVATGVVSFQCTASDTASPVHTATVSVDTLVDHGPEIDIVDPADGSAHNLLGPMSVEFDTAPVLVAKGDKQADVSAVTLTVGGTKIETTAAGNGKYKATVDFTDKKLFGAPPDGMVPVVLTAANKRKLPGAAIASKSYQIVVDGTGPEIVIASPGVSAVVGPNSVLTFTVTDIGAGVDQDTVSVKLNDTSYSFAKDDGNWTVNTSGQFTFKFGAKLTKETDTQVTVNLFAKDKAANASPATSRLYNLDNQPPVVDLDPPAVFEVRTGTDPKTLQCSDAFDPVGPVAPNDKQTIVNFGRFRALVWDETNTKLNQTDFFFAGTDQSSAQIFVQFDTSAPLLKGDTVDSGSPPSVCNEIWSGSPPNQYKPTDKPLPRLSLTPVLLNSGRGAPSWGTSPPALAECAPGPSSTAAGLCLNQSSDMTVVIHHPTGVKEPVVYAIEPVDNSSDALCTGKEWDVGTAISTASGSAAKLGWVCMAARAVDQVGNIGVSSPLRICLADADHPNPCAGITPPSCTDGCIAPAHFPKHSDELVVKDN